MGVAGSGPHGLSIKTIEMTYDAGSHHVTRVSEAGIIFQFGAGVGDHSAIRQRGLKLGFRIRRAHVSAQMAFTTGATTSGGQPAPPAAQYVPLTQDPQVTQELISIFGTDSCRFLFWSWPTEQWIGFNIAASSIPAPVSPAAADRLFFRIVLGRLDTSHVKDCDLVPVVAGFGDVPLQQHYALGLSVYSKGPAAGGPVFDTQMLGNS
jgi:hypothetical protein